MSARLCKYLPVLKLLHKATPKQRRLILQSASDEFILALCEVALNILYGVIPVSRQQYQKLKKRKADIKFVADKKNWHSGQETSLQPEGRVPVTAPKRRRAVSHELDSESLGWSMPKRCI